MSTAYTERVKVIIEGEIEEDIGTHNTEVLILELRLLCAKYGLDLSEEE